MSIIIDKIIETKCMFEFIEYIVVDYNNGINFYPSKRYQDFQPNIHYKYFFIVNKNNIAYVLHKNNWSSDVLESLNIKTYYDISEFVINNIKVLNKLLNLKSFI